MDKVLQTLMLFQTFVDEFIVKGVKMRFKLTYIIICLALLIVAASNYQQSFQQKFLFSVQSRLMASTTNIDETVTNSRIRARKLFMALTGVSVSIDDSRVKMMESLIQTKQEATAVKIATADPNFYNIRVADMARKMSSRDEFTRAPLSDFVATFVGVTRDGVSAQQLLTGNFVYIMDPSLGFYIDSNGNKLPIKGKGANVNIDLSTTPVWLDFVKYNDYYEFIESQNLSLFHILTRKDGQLIGGMHDIIGATGQSYPMQNPDPAGLLTSRAFLQAHADAGTNRRLIEYSFREFMCTPMANMADANQPDDRVGRDVERSPGGSVDKYQTTCKACHAVMDSFRGAFAYFDIRNMMAVYYPQYKLKVDLTPYPPPTTDTNDPNGYPNYVGYKMNKKTAGTTLSPDFQFAAVDPVIDDSWLNRADGATNADNFGWRGSASGKGAHAFGELLASSQGFSRCMVKRVFTEVCKRAPTNEEKPLVKSLARDFENGGYQIRELFENVAVQPECLGVNN